MMLKKNVSKIEQKYIDIEKQRICILKRNGGEKIAKKTRGK